MYFGDFSNSLLKNMLISVSVFMLHSGYDQKFAFVRTVLDFRHTFQRLVFVFGQEQNEAQRVVGVGQQSIDVLQ